MKAEFDLGTPNDTELDRHSPLADVIECMLIAVQNLSDNEYIYKDDAADTNIHTEEVQVIINQLRHSNVDAIEVADTMTALAYKGMFDDGQVILVSQGEKK